MKKAIWNSSWNEIKFNELGVKLNFFKRPSASFYSKFYDELYKRFNSFDDLPLDYQTTKINTAKEIKKFLSHTDEVLSYGCGLGFIEKELANNAEFNNLYAYDFSKTPPKWLENVGKVQYISEISQSKKYDLIYCAQVFYSMDDKEIEKLISSFKSLLKKSGKVLTIDTSIRNYENCNNKNTGFFVMSKLKNIIRPLYLFLLRSNENQFWGWSRDNNEIVKIFKKNDYRLIKSYGCNNQAFQIFIPNDFH